MISRFFFYTICNLLIFIDVFGQSIKQTVDGNNAFAFELFKEVFKEDQNTFLSPYSISSALAMTYAGAKNETEKQMSKVLHYDLNQLNTHRGFFEINKSLAKNNNDSTIKLSVANALWKDKGWHFKEDYLDLTKKYYNASILPLTDAKTINNWADANTNGKIKEIVTDEDITNSRLVLTNAIYLKGDWLTSFNETNTHKTKFSITEINMIDVDMMFQENEVNYFEDEQNQVIELPYKGESMSMIFILPNKNSFVSNSTTNLNKLYSALSSNFSKRKVKVFIPKFSFTSGYSLPEVLSRMGMPNAFNLSRADFTGMSTGLSISDVIHKAFIEVNEKGSQAAAATAVIMDRSSFRKEITFKADRPFIVLINDKNTGSILFIGAVINPNQN